MVPFKGPAVVVVVVVVVEVVVVGEGLGDPTWRFMGSYKWSSK